MNIIHYGQYRTKHTLRGADHKNFWRCSMDTALLVTILVLAVIAAVEMLCLFLCSKLRTNVLPIVAAVPVHGSDKCLAERLEFLGELMLRSSSAFDRVVLIDMGASPEQSEMCRLFCNNYPRASFVSSSELQSTLFNEFSIKKEL